MKVGYLGTKEFFKKSLRHSKRIIKIAKHKIGGKQQINFYDFAIDWLKNSRIKNGGIPVTSKRLVSYPEVTGYSIPTLYRWGEKEFAKNLALWLLTQQNADGSFSAPDGTPYTFDTGQAVRGYLAVLDDLLQAEMPLIKACNWILTQVQPSGRLLTPSTRMWVNIADDRIHLYVLPPLIKVGERFNESKYIDAAYCVLKYYKHQKGLVEFNILSHFYAYIIDALCDLEEIGLAKEGMEAVVALQRKDGSIPAYKDVSWICSTGVAQFAVIGYKLGMKEFADKAINYLQKIQNRSGGFNGSYGKKASYFAKEEISWAVKFFLDAYYWKIKTTFNQRIDVFPESIEEVDGRVQEILSFLENLDDKKVLDVGCGRGRFLRILKSKFPNAQLYGLDISEKMLSFCPPGVETICGSILNIRYPDAYFDCIFCVETLEHALRIESAIKEMVRILKRGGKIIIIDKNSAKLGVLNLEPWEQWFKPKDIINLLSKYGVEAHYKLIAYGKHSQPDGLFIAWEGIRI